VVTPDPATLVFAPEWVPPQRLLSAGPGMHRFVWDIHYAGPAHAEKRRETGGVWAPPGNYTVELAADGQTLRQPLIVKPDPRVKIAPAAYEREFALAVKVQAASEQISAALKEAALLLMTLEERKAGKAELRPQIEQVEADVSALSDVPLPTKVRAGRENLPLRTDSLQSLQADFEKLKSAVDGTDADPSADSLVSYAELSKTLSNTLRAWEQLKRKELASLDTRLKAEGEKPLDP